MMRPTQRYGPREPRAGIIIAFLMVTIVLMIGFLALAIDIGMLTLSRDQSQNAADAAAMAGARALDGTASSNLGTAYSRAQAVAVANTVLASPVKSTGAVPASPGGTFTSDELKLESGAYDYQKGNGFQIQQPTPANSHASLITATVTPTRGSFFSKIWGVTGLTVSATGTAAHRPRDVAIILDFSGSMNNESDLWGCESYLGAQQNKPNNADSTHPHWGQYSTDPGGYVTYSPGSATDQLGRSNVSTTALGVPAIIGDAVNGTNGDFFQNPSGNASGVNAFNPAPASVTNDAPGGDQPLFQKGSSSVYATNVKDYTGLDTASNATVPFLGYTVPPYRGKIKNGATVIYDGTSDTRPAPNDPNKTFFNADTRPPFNGFTQGPGWWGMTFFLWPPEPTDDWRCRFFLKDDGSPITNANGASNVNNSIFYSGNNWNDPSGNYRINYKAILTWLKKNAVQAGAGDPKPFPTLLRGGKIKYYDNIPVDVPPEAYIHSNRNWQITTWADDSQRFWKEYIDFVLGVWRDPNGNIVRPGSPSCSYGPDLGTGGDGQSPFGTVTNAGADLPPLVSSGPLKYDPKINGTSPAVFPDTIALSPKNQALWYPNFTRTQPANNPIRPRHRFWFGPMTMVQFILDCGFMPGTGNDISMNAAKKGMNGAVTNIQFNHPNDRVAILPFSRPPFTGEAPEEGQFRLPVVPLCNDYIGMTDALFYPPGGSGAPDVTVFSTIGDNAPRTHGDFTSNTATQYGLMLAYNQFSGQNYYSGQQYTSERDGSLVNYGGEGRSGSQRLVILETDGMANLATNATTSGGVSGSGPTAVNNSYYSIQPGASLNAIGEPSTGDNAVAVARRMCALVTDSTNGPGFATPSKPVTIQVLAFGCIMEKNCSWSGQQTIVNFCRNISHIGQTGFPDNVNTTTDSANPGPNPSEDVGWKIIVGTQTDREVGLRTAITNILEQSIPVSMIK